MSTYLSTQQLSDMSGIAVAEIRILEERGVLKAAPGREKFRKRWTKTAPYDLRRALTVHSLPENNHPFNAVLAPGTLAAAAAPPEPTTTTTTRFEEAMACFHKRIGRTRMSTQSAEAVVSAWLEVRPTSRNDMSALLKVTEYINKGKTRSIANKGSIRILAIPTIRAYLVHTGLIKRLQPPRGRAPSISEAPVIKRGRGRPRLTPEQRAVRLVANAEKARIRRRERRRAAAPPPVTPVADTTGLKRIMPLLKQLLALHPTPQERAFLIAWRQTEEK